MQFKSLYEIVVMDSVIKLLHKAKLDENSLYVPIVYCLCFIWL